MFHIYLCYCYRNYLTDMDYDFQYGSLGVSPLPLHGQVRPIKVEQDTWHHNSTDEHNISSTPILIRRRARKREADESHEVSLKIYVSFLKKLCWKVHSSY